ncbi:MAG: S8 family serine peptidase, partial [Planctomycetia bacterium]|nr:S8 family serine peptidase [Planctomycetia bacterium]
MGFVTQLVSWLRRPAEAPLRRPLKRLHFETLEERTLLDASFPELVVDPQVFAPSSLLVSFQDGAAPADVLPDGASLGDALPLVPGLYEVQLGGSLTVAAAMEALRANPLVRFAEPDYEVHVDFIPNDTFFGSLWGLHNTGQSGGLLDADIDAPEAWDVTMGSGSVIVAVIDTGVDYNHPDLAANIWTNFGEIAGNGRDDDFNGYVDDVHGYDFYSNDGNPMDGNGHGTHVAGTIGAVANNARGVAGVNPNVRIMALQFMSASGSGFTSDAVRAINYAVANGASISNNSWGGGGFSTSLFNAIANARAQGHIFVAAAGNNGSNNDFSPHYPSNYNLDNVVSVAATDRLDNLAWFSNYGATTVDLGAPGVSILSTYPGNRYATLSGTSMASPHVAGALALIRDLHPEYTYLEAINQLLSSVDPLPSLSGLMVSGGRLNVANALAGPSLPRISINDVSVLEGNSGTVDAVFTVTLSAASSDFVTVDYATANGTATAGSDYEAAVGTVTFVPGETSQTVAVTVNGDTTPEPNETFFVNLSNPSGATLLDGQGVGTIRNDDLPSLSID